LILLIAYVMLALVVSFLCSIAEAVLLSVTSAHIAVLEGQGNKAGPVLAGLKGDINKPLSAILTLNTVAHTVGAAGAGAQAAVVFGSAYLGVASAVLTFLILIFSEIIPKTLGATHWKALAPAVGKSLKWLVWVLYPWVKLMEKMTGRMKEGPMLSGFSRQEFAAMAELSADEGQLGQRESNILKNLMLLRKTKATDVMTPRTVVFSLPQTTTVKEYFDQYGQSAFSRVPIYSDDPDHVVGFVLRQDLLRAHSSNEKTKQLKDYLRVLPVIPELMVLSRVFDEIVRSRTHITLVVDEYGTPAGIVTLEDILETLLGFEIMDEGDEAEDMQAYARELWEKRATRMGIDLERLEAQITPLDQIIPDDQKLPEDQIGPKDQKAPKNQKS